MNYIVLLGRHFKKTFEKSVSNKYHACLAIQTEKFSPTISGPSTFLSKKKKKKENYFFFSKIWILKGIPVKKLAMQNFIFTASIKYKFTYTTFLTAEDTDLT